MFGIAKWCKTQKYNLWQPKRLTQSRYTYRVYRETLKCGDREKIMSRIQEIKENNTFLFTYTENFSCALRICQQNELQFDC